MIQFDKNTIGRQAKELGFVRDTFENLDKMPQNKIKTDLLPVLRFGAYFDLKPARKKVTDYLKELLVLTPQEAEFIELFGNGEYKPELILKDDMLNNVSAHPMAIWKCNKIKGNIS